MRHEGEEGGGTVEGKEIIVAGLGSELLGVCDGGVESGHGCGCRGGVMLCGFGKRGFCWRRERLVFWLIT